MESTRRKPTAMGKQKTSLHVPGEVKTDETCRSHPISAACQSAWRTAGLVVPLGTATAYSCWTLVYHARGPRGETHKERKKRLSLRQGACLKPSPVA
jgi:hypothetical protein